MEEPRKPDFVYEAEAKKLKAEAESIAQEIKRQAARDEAEAKKLNAEAESLTAEAEGKRHEARKQKAYADSAEIDLVEKQRQRDEVYAHNDFYRIYRFDGQVKEDTVKVCMKTLDVWRRLGPGKPITIIFSSPGGEVVAGLALFDYLQEMRDSGIHLTTVAQGMAASMAGILLQAGDVRIMGKESYILVHEIQAGMMGSFGELEDRMKWLSMVQRRMLDTYATRCSQATGQTFAAVRKQIEKEWKRTDWWLDSAEAKRLGFVDEVR